MSAPRRRSEDAEILRGRGFAQARYVHGRWPGVGAAWSAWVADVAVNRSTGEVSVTRVVVGQDTGMMINPAGVRHQIHGNVVQSTSRVLKEEVQLHARRRRWRQANGAAIPILAFPDLPAIDVMMMDRQHEPPLGAGESASVPSAAAIVNAVYDATGVRFRELPLTPERVLAALGTTGASRARLNARRRTALLGSHRGDCSLGLLGLAALAMPIRPAPSRRSRGPIPRLIPPPRSSGDACSRRLAPAPSVTPAPGGAAYAGGLAVADALRHGDCHQHHARSSRPASAPGPIRLSTRAMREGIHRDGRHLYPAFPYPSFTRASEADLQALYAFLMAQPAVTQATRPRAGSLSPSTSAR